MLILTILFPLLGVAVSALPAADRTRRGLYLAVMALTDALGAGTLAGGGRAVLFSLTPGFALSFAADGMGKLFLALVLLLYSVSTVYSLEYLRHDGRQRVFFGFWFASLTAMLAVCLAGNLVSLYLCFELATLSTMPLVLHDRTPEAVAAALKYLFYSIGGALLGLCAVLALSMAGAGEFAYGGSLGEGGGALRWAVFLGVVGFGTKAGMFPMNGWLPAAHPVAPAPASAILSGVIVKAGILAVIRLVWYSAGPELLRGTGAQTAWTVLALCTVFLGSMMAWRERNLKRRLAYSTVSQLSYIMLGLSLLCEAGLRGALLHVCAHACAKGALFLCAGGFLHCLGKREVSLLRGVGRRMPLTVWCFLLSGMSLIGLPPLGGFVSKWRIASAALAEAPGVFVWLIPVMLLLSALLTAAYLLPPVVEAFFPPRGQEEPGERAEKALMTVPTLLLCCASLALGLFGGALL